MNTDEQTTLLDTEAPAPPMTAANQPTADDTKQHAEESVCKEPVVADEVVVDIETEAPVDSDPLEKTPAEAEKQPAADAGSATCVQPSNRRIPEYSEEELVYKEPEVEDDVVEDTEAPVDSEPEEKARIEAEKQAALDAARATYMQPSNLVALAMKHTSATGDLDVREFLEEMGKAGHPFAKAGRHATVTVVGYASMAAEALFKSLDVDFNLYIDAFLTSKIGQAYHSAVVDQYKILCDVSGLPEDRDREIEQDDWMPSGALSWTTKAKYFVVFTPTRDRIAGDRAEGDPERYADWSYSMVCGPRQIAAKLYAWFIAVVPSEDAVADRFRERLMSKTCGVISVVDTTFAAFMRTRPAPVVVAPVTTTTQKRARATTDDGAAAKEMKRKLDNQQDELDDIRSENLALRAKLEAIDAKLNSRKNTKAGNKQNTKHGSRV